MKYTAILFDLDGTLTDPKLGITRAIQYALTKLGIPEPDPENLVKFIGPPLMQSFQQFYSFDEVKVRDAVSFYREYFSRSGMYENELYPGILELLSKLKQTDRKLFIATSKPTVFAEPIARHFGIDQYFNQIVGSNLDGTRSVKAELITEVLNGLDAGEKKKAVMIGDRKYDIIGAKTCGIDSIAVTYGYGAMAELQEAEPTFFANSMDELWDLISCTTD